MLILDFDEDELPHESDEKVKLEPEETIAERRKLNRPKRKRTGMGLKIMTPNKLLATLPILLAQIKAENNCIFCINTIESPKRFKTILSSHYNDGGKYDCDKRSQNFLF